jgi:hypothetical protein
VRKKESIKRDDVCSSGDSYLLVHEEQRKRRRFKDAYSGLKVPWEENWLGKEKSKWNHGRRVLAEKVLVASFIMPTTRLKI